MRKAKGSRVLCESPESEFFAKSIDVLGHVIDNEGLKPAPKKMRKIENWTTPKTKKKLQEVLGTFNYISQFLPHLVRVTAPLMALAGTAEFVWTLT